MAFSSGGEAAQGQSKNLRGRRAYQHDHVHGRQNFSCCSTAAKRKQPGRQMIGFTEDCDDDDENQRWECSGYLRTVSRLQASLILHAATTLHMRSSA
eukprot:8290507-Pyramimonas_sp.AAC.1